MPLQPERHFAPRATRLRPSEIREILQLTQRPEVISFAGGLPDPDSFPLKVVRELTAELLDEHGAAMLQYGVTRGVPELRTAIAALMRTEGIDTTAEGVLITSGSQQGIKFLCDLFLAPGDSVMVGSPTYLGLKLLLQYHDVRPIPVAVDDQGMDPASVEEALRHGERKGVRPKFLYTMPTFQNPTGVTLSATRRRRLLDLASAYDLLVVEDDPYSRLRFEGEALRPLAALDDEQRVIYLSTFSKLLAPGLRIAWMSGHPAILEKVHLAKQSDDLHTNTLGQYLTEAFLSRGHFERHLPTLRKVYLTKRDAMLGAMEAHFPPTMSWTRPQGGLFTWVTGPPALDTSSLLREAIARDVAFVTGPSFYTQEGAGRNCMRLNYSHPSVERIAEGIQRLGAALQAHLGRLPTKTGEALGTT